MKTLYSFPLSLNKRQGNWEKIFKQNNSVTPYLNIICIPLGVTMNI